MWHDSSMRDMTHHTWDHSSQQHVHAAIIATQEGNEDAKHCAFAVCEMTDPYVPWLIHIWRDSFVFTLSRTSTFSNHSNTGRKTRRGHRALALWIGIVELVSVVLNSPRSDTHQMCDEIHLYVRHDSVMCAMTQSDVWHGSVIWVTRLGHVCQGSLEWSSLYS